MLNRTFPLFMPFLLVFGFFSAAKAAELSDKQKAITDRYGQLEQILFRMSEATASANPQRAALLKRVLQSSKEKLVALRLGQTTDILAKKQLADAIANQESIEKDLVELLKLLESENGEQKRDMEKKKVEELLRKINEIIGDERGIQRKTMQQEGKNLPKVAEEQQEIQKKAKALLDEAKEVENPDGKNSENKSSENKGEKTDGQKSDNKNSMGKQGEKQESGEKKEPQEGQKGQKGQKGEQGEQEQQQQEDEGDTPTQKALKKALDHVKKAEEKLKEAEKNGALEQEEEAIARWHDAKAELEKILRQLREEELMQTLEKLEARFKRMLTIEQGIRSQTEKLGKEVGNDETKKRQLKIQAGQLGADQQTVIDDADASMILLREDGTAQALAEALLQARFDMVEAKKQLDETDLGSVTLSVEDAVIAALKEMLEAVQLAMEESEKRQEREKQGQPPPQGQNQQEPLIQILSELKMIRSMQRRVNERTERYDKMIEDERTKTPPNFDPLRLNVDELTRQQNRIKTILHEIKIGKTQ